MSDQKVALVTGAGSGIGRGVSIGLLGDGFRVVLAGRRQAQLEETAAQSGAPASRVLTVPTDVTDPESVRALFTKTAAAFGRLDVLFNNAGISAPGVLLEDLTVDQWKAVVDTNLTGPFLCTQYAPRPNSAPYTATKHAITGLTKSTALDGRKYNIACGQIDIGNAATEMAAKMAKGVPQANGTIAAEPLLDLGCVVDAVRYMAGLPLGANVQFLTVMATKMPYIGRG